MSVRVMSWVWDNSGAEGLERLVLLAIADSAGDDGGNAWPSMATLVKKAKVSERTVQRAIRALVAAGELTVRPNAGKNGVNVYAVTMTPRQADTPSDSHPVTETPRQADAQGVSASHPDPRHSDTQTILEPSTTRPKNLSSVAPRPDVDRICEHLADRIEANGSKRPAVTERWRKSARLMLDNDDRTETKVHACIDWCQSDDFWRGVVLSMPKLREKYDQLRLAAQRSVTPTTNGGSTTDKRVSEARSVVDRLRSQERGELSA